MSFLGRMLSGPLVDLLTTSWPFPHHPPEKVTMLAMFDRGESNEAVSKTCASDRIYVNWRGGGCEGDMPEIEFLCNLASLVQLRSQGYRTPGVICL